MLNFLGKKRTVSDTFSAMFSGMYYLCHQYYYMDDPVYQIGSPCDDQDDLSPGLSRSTTVVHGGDSWVLL